MVTNKVGREDDSGTRAVVRTRSLRFIIWQSIQSTLIFTLLKLLLLLFSSKPNTNTNLLTSFLAFHFSLLSLSLSLSLLSSPLPLSSASLFDLAARAARVVFVSGSGQGSDRVRVSLSYFGFVLVAGFSGSIGLGSLCGFSKGFIIKGFAIGSFYGVLYLYHRRFVLDFPIIQRPSFFSFKMGIPFAAHRALRLSIGAYVFSAVLAIFIPYESKARATIGKFISEQIACFIGIFVVFLCWELNHHLHQVLHTKRVIFAPPKGSAAAETNPSEPLLAALEESTPRSLIQYLAFRDLCMVCENNVDTWRRAAFFEETSETYKRVMTACLKPLEQFVSQIVAGLESNNSMEKSFQLSNQLKAPTNLLSESRIYEAFYEFQLCTWSARIVASLTVHSHNEDRFGVAQLSGSNAAAMSALLSCLLAVEALMGKKTNLQSPHQLTGPANIKWATQSSSRREVAATGVIVKKRGNPLYSKAYSMADVLKTSIYYVVYAFHDEMVHGDKSGILDNDWITSSKPLFGTRELLLQKLRLFLEYRAN